MTRREQQILRWIEENPMISQQELAERAGITRSSVAVHIANLMKKGLIAGRGYILAAETYAADYQKLMEIDAERSSLDEQLLALYEQWEELNQ